MQTGLDATETVVMLPDVSVASSPTEYDLGNAVQRVRGWEGDCEAAGGTLFRGAAVSDLTIQQVPIL